MSGTLVFFRGEALTGLVLAGACGGFLGALPLRHRRLWSAFPALALAGVLWIQGGRAWARWHKGRIERVAFETEVVALLEGLQASFEAGLNLDAALRLQRERARWKSSCHEVLDLFVAARGAGLGFREAALGAGRVASGHYDARFLRAAMLCLADGSVTGVELSRVAAAFAERIRASQQMRHRALALSAQVRFQARLLLATPFVLAALLALLRPSYLAFFVSKPSGLALLALMAFLHGAAIVALRRLLSSVGIGKGS